MSHAFDANASRAVLPAAWEAYVRATSLHGDPTAPHAAGKAARAALAEARQRVAAVVGAPADTIVFVSGGTEAAACALAGVMHAVGGGDVVSHVIEHPAVRGTVQMLGAPCQSVTVGAQRDGRVAPADVLQALTSQTRLVTLMLANNETGVLQPVADVAAVCRSKDITLHTDAVQAMCRVPIDVQRLGVDLMTWAGHKLGSVAGIGAVYVRPGTPFAPPWRPPNPALTGPCAYEDPGVSVALAMSMAVAMEEGMQRLQRGITVGQAALRDAFEARVVQALGRVADGPRRGAVEVLGQTAERLPQTSALRFAGCEADGIMMALDVGGFCVSTGSACASGSIEASEVLRGMGLTDKEARQVVRFSFDETATADAIEALAQSVIEVVRRM